MPIVYHGGDYEITKIDPRWMFHGESVNRYGIGIYFTKWLKGANGAEDYGEYIYTINTDGLNLVNYHTHIFNIDNSKIEKFIRYLHKTKSWSTYNIRRMDKRLLKIDSKMITWRLDLIELFSSKEFNEEILEKFMNRKSTFPNKIPIFRWQLTLAALYGEDNIKEFVIGWNKIMKIDGFETGKVGFFPIINPTVKISFYSYNQPKFRIGKVKTIY